MNEYQNLINIRNHLYNQFPVDTPFFFITINLPYSLKTHDLYCFIGVMRYILGKFEKRLLGGTESWINHPYMFYAFCENQFNTNTWHIHLLAPLINPITNTQLSLDFVRLCFHKANRTFRHHFKMNRGVDCDIRLVPYSDIKNVISYCTKEIPFYDAVCIDRVYTPATLFYKHEKLKKRHRRKQVSRQVRKIKSYQDLVEVMSKKYTVKHR